MLPRRDALVEGLRGRAAGAATAGRVVSTAAAGKGRNPAQFYRVNRRHFVFLRRLRRRLVCKLKLLTPFFQFNQPYIKLLDSLVDLGNYPNNIKDIESVRNLIYLESLSLEYNQIQSIDPLSGLLNLKELYLNTNKINDISALYQIHELKILAVENNQINDISVLSNLQSLEKLYVKNNHIDDVSAIAQCHNLYELSIGGNRIKNSDISNVSNSIKIIN